MTVKRLKKYLLLIVALTVAVPASGNQERPNEDFRAQLKRVVLEAKNSFIDEFDAEVWLTEQANRLAKVAPHIPREEQFSILKLTHHEAKKQSLDPLLVLAVINVESNFDHYALSNAGARGLMQVMPFWKDEIGQPDDDLFDMQTNLQYGCAILRLYLDKENRDMTRALARYNGSKGQHWYPMRVYQSMRDTWFP